jgi:hypothetical protein
LQVKNSVNIIFRWGCHWIDHSIQRPILVQTISRTESVQTHIIFKWGCHRTDHSIQHLTLVHRISAKKICTYYIEIGLSREVAFDKHALDKAKLYLTLHTWYMPASAYEVLIQGAK